MLLSMARILNKYIVWDIMYIIDEYIPGTPCAYNVINKFICNNCCECIKLYECSVCGCSVCYSCCSDTECGHGTICCNCDVHGPCDDCDRSYCKDCITDFNTCEGCHEKICNKCTKHETFNCCTCKEYICENDNYSQCFNCYDRFCDDCSSKYQLILKCSQCTSIVCVSCMIELNDENKVYCSGCIEIISD